MRPRWTLALPFAAAALLLASSPRFGPAQPSPEAISTGAVAEYWLRLYPIERYSEIWRLSLRVPDIRKAVAKAVSAVEKIGGRPILPIENMASSRTHGYQQLSYQVPADSAGKAVKALQALGEVQGLVKNPSSNPAVAQEVQEKLAQLRSERDANGQALGRMPAIAALAAELLKHLEAVSGAGKEAAGRVLLNLELQEAPSAKKPR